MHTFQTKQHLVERYETDQATVQRLQTQLVEDQCWNAQLEQDMHASRCAHVAEWDGVHVLLPPIGMPDLDKIREQARANHRDHWDRDAAVTRKPIITAEDDQRQLKRVRKDNRS